MKLQVKRMEVSHMQEILEHQPEIAKHISIEQIEALAANKYSHSIVDVFGRVIAVGGIIEEWAGRGRAWAILDQQSRQYFLSIHKKVKKFLKDSGINRIEADVDCDFEQGHRWVELLGFKLECESRSGFGPAGNDCSLYALMKEVI